MGSERKLAEGAEEAITEISYLIQNAERYFPQQALVAQKAVSRLRALLEVSAGEVLREAHNACRCGGRQLVLSQAEPPFQMECDGLHAALDAAVAAAVREEREKRGHVKGCYCHHICGGGAFLWCDGTKHPYTDPRCSEGTDK